MHRFTYGRRFCVTEKGYIGLVPQRAANGGVVYVLQGAHVPNVVRPIKATVSDETIGELLGGCNIHGLMHGEAMLDESMGFCDVILA